MIHITLTERGLRPANDPLGRTFYGWAPEASIPDNWENNRGDWVLGVRAERENYVVFSNRGTVVMAAKIGSILNSPSRPGRKIIEGELLTKGHPVYDTYVGGPTPEDVRGSRNPINYLDAAVGGRPCECECGTEVYSGRFVRGHDQTALHQRVAKIGRVTDFLDWFDAVYGGAEQSSATTSSTLTISHEGRIDLTAAPGGRVTLSFTPTAA